MHLLIPLNHMTTNSQQQSNNKLDEEKHVTEIVKSDPEVDANVCPDSFTGWGLLTLIGSTLIQVTTWGSNSAFALYYQNYVNDNVFPEATVIDYGGVGGLAFGSGVFLAPLINLLVAKVGVRQTVFIGIWVQFVGVLLASSATKLWQLYPTQGFLQGLGMALISVPAMPVLPQWFTSRRNLAMGIQSAGTGIGGIIFNVGMEPIMTKYGWRWALRTQAIICCGLTLISLMMIRTRDQQLKTIRKVFDKEIATQAGTYYLIFSTIVIMFGYVVLLFNLGDFTRSLGYSQQQASIVSTLVTVGSIFGRPLVGLAADRIGPIQATILTTFISAILVFAMWIPCKNYATTVAFGLIQGSVIGTIFMTITTMNAELVGMQKLPIGLAVSSMAMASGGCTGPIIASALRGTGTDAYRDPALFTGSCYVAGTISLLVLKGWLVSRDFQVNFARGLLKRIKV